MKNVTKFLAIAMVFFATQAFAQVKIGHININELVELMPERDSAVVKLQNYAKELDETMQGMQQEFNTKYQTYQQKSATWTAAILEAKTKELQEIIQKNPAEHLTYVLVGESGPDHDKRFEVEVLLNSNVIGMGVGISKKGAEQEAAKSALEGHLYQKAKAVRDNLLVLVGHITAYTDFPEEAVEEVTDDEIEEILKSAQGELKRLIDGYDAGAKIKDGVRTAIVGKPNVGKSTLLNALSGFEKAIVTEIAGTTRDVVEQEVILGDVNLILQDTAGIRETDDIVEAMGIQRSIDRLKDAQLVFCVFDGSREISDEDIDLAKRCENNNSIAIINKQDLEQKFDIAKIEHCFKKVLYITAKEFYMSKEFEQTVMEVLNLTHIDSQVATVVNERQFAAVRTAYAAISDAYDAFLMGQSLDIVGVCIDDALYAIYQLTGENVSDEVVSEVFSKFCVGK